MAEDGHPDIPDVARPGCYHEELDIHHNGGYRYTRDPHIFVNDEDVYKYEYMQNVPVCIRKAPVEFPVAGILRHRIVRSRSHSFY